MLKNKANFSLWNLLIDTCEEIGTAMGKSDFIITSKMRKRRPEDNTVIYSTEERKYFLKKCCVVIQDDRKGNWGDKGEGRGKVWKQAYSMRDSWNVKLCSEGWFDSQYQKFKARIILRRSKLLIYIGIMLNYPDNTTISHISPSTKFHRFFGLYISILSHHHQSL